MTTHTIGIIMNGVTGRMGLNQHLRRSIHAIMQQGGVKIERQRDHRAAPAAGGPESPPSWRPSPRSSAACRGPPISTAALADPGLLHLFRRADHRPARAGRPQGHRRRQARLLRKAGCGQPGDGAAISTAWRETAGIKHGVVQDKLWLPGLLKLQTPVATWASSGAFSRVRGEFGYWVFEGDTVPAQRPSWNYRKEDGGGIILDMLCHWRYVLDNLFGAVKAVSCLGATHVPTPLERSRQALRVHGRRFGLRHLRAGRRHRRPLQFVVVRARAPRRPADPSGGWHQRLGRRRPARLLDSALWRDAAAGVESRISKAR